MFLLNGFRIIERFAALEFIDAVLRGDDIGIEHALVGGDKCVGSEVRVGGKEVS